MKTKNCANLSFAFIFSAIANLLSTPAFGAGEVAFLLDLRTMTSSFDDKALGKNISKFGVANNEDSNTLLTYGVAPTLANDKWLFSASALGDTLDDGSLDLTEIFIAYSAPSDSAWSSLIKTGFFFAPFSLENREKFWQSPYTLTPSAINSWIGEEVRTLGSEVSLDYKGSIDNNDWRFTGTMSIFAGNDPAGSLIAWRGFALHNRISSYSESINLPNLNSLQTNGSFPLQAQEVEPFKEIDDEAGVYAGLRTSYAKKTQFGFWHYDNRGNPVAFKNGQYAWHTVFDLFSFKQVLSNQWEILAQHMNGSTLMGAQSTRVENSFTGSYLLINKLIGKHSISVRFDRFAVDDEDETIDDNNTETGKAFTLAWLMHIDQHLHFGVEFLNIQNKHPEFVNLGLPNQFKDNQFALSAALIW